MAQFMNKGMKFKETNPHYMSHFEGLYQHFNEDYFLEHQRFGQEGKEERD